MGRVPVRTVDAAPGSLLDLAVLAPARRSCVAVDMATNAVLRVHHPRQEYIAPFTVVRAHVSVSTQDRLEQPESIEVAESLLPIGRIMGLRCERLLRSIDSALNHPTLGFVGPGISLWELDGSRPSVVTRWSSRSSVGGSVAPATGVASMSSLARSRYSSSLTAGA